MYVTPLVNPIAVYEVVVRPETSSTKTPLFKPKS